MIKHYKLKISGKVQGVWYRGSTQKKAKELGLAGFVKNEPDGSVYVEVEGSADKISDLVKWCRKGPELARVKSVGLEEGKMIGFAQFDILR